MWSNAVIKKWIKGALPGFNGISLNVLIQNFGIHLKPITYLGSKFKL